MKKIFGFMLSLLFVMQMGVFAHADSNPESEFKIHSEYVYLMNLDMGDVIYEKNADKQAYPASLTKIMTCILALESVPYEELDRTILMYPTYVQEYLYNYQVNLGANVSLAGLMAGEQITMKDLLYGLMVRSGNETSMIIADYLGEGTGLERQESFLKKMNARAKELGATSTNFANTNGLHDSQNVTTARDMALITRHAMGLVGFMDIVNTTSYIGGPTNKSETLEWSTTNQMLVPSSEYYYPYLSGIKTGTLPESGRCLITSATKDGFSYLLVLMGAPYMDEQTKEVYPQRYDYQDTKNIYEWVFNNFKVKILVEKMKIVHDIPLKLSSQQDYIQLATAERFTSLVDVAVDPATSVLMEFDVPESIDAPVEKGQHVGYVDLILYGEVVGRVELVAFESVESSPLLVFWERVKSFLSSFWFKFAVIFLVLLITFYIIIMVLRNRRRRRHGGYRSRRRL